MVKKLTYEFVKAEIEKEGFTLLSKEYVNAHEKLLIKCSQNHIFKMPWNSFQRGYRCRLCADKRTGLAKRLTQEEFVERVEKTHKGKVKVIGTYITSTDKVELFCTKCNKRYFQKAGHTLSGHGCPTCGNNKIGDRLRKTHKEFAQEVFDLVGNEYTLLEKYKKDYVPIKTRHNLCGREFNLTPTSFIQGTRCPHCRESKGEKEVSSYLKEKNLEFKSEVRLDGCRYKYTLPFDFGIYDDNELICLIEYDGELHYHTARWHNAEKELKLTQKRDRIKTDYCKENNIPLIRIPYWEFNNIEKTLNEKLKRLEVL